MSENIHVRSVMGRVLEHPRVFYFLNNDEPEVYLSSADWMPRNFFRRVEVAFPVEDPTLRNRVVTESIETYLADNSQAWVLQSDGSYRRVKPGAHKPRLAQSALLEQLAG